MNYQQEEQKVKNEYRLPPSNERVFLVSSRKSGVPIRKKGYVSPVGGYVHNAKTNEIHGVRVGTKAEEMFFKVSYCDGTIGEDHMLFFLSPEDCEHFFELTLQSSVKKAWFERTTNKPITK
jgi:hypothetical protein